MMEIKEKDHGGGSWRKAWVEKKECVEEKKCGDLKKYGKSRFLFFQRLTKKWGPF